VLGVRLAAVLGTVAAATAVLGAWYLTRGAPDVGLDLVVSAIRDPQLAEADTGAYLVRELRLPRLLLAVLAGAGLGMAGVIMQDALRNPIADPGLLGISQAAALVVALLIFFPGTLPAIGRPALALLAGLATGGLLVLLARSIRDPVRLVLIGVTLALLYGAATTAVVYVAPTEGGGIVGLPQLLTFTTGSLVYATWARLHETWPWLAVAVPIALLSGRMLNLLQLGDDVAAGLGMRVTRARFGLFLVAMLLVAPVVSAVGPLAFVALLSPHVTRALLGTSNAYAVLPASAAIGALVVLLADATGRLLLFPSEVPAGIWTIVVAGPFAIWLAGSRLRAPSAVVAGQ
jgi:iron complex transport system permease protein